MASLSPNTSITPNTPSVDGLGNVYRSYELAFDDDRGLDVFIVQTQNGSKNGDDKEDDKEEDKEDIQREEKNNNGQP